MVCKVFINQFCQLKHELIEHMPNLIKCEVSLCMHEIDYMSTKNLRWIL